MYAEDSNYLFLFRIVATQLLDVFLNLCSIQWIMPRKQNNSHELDKNASIIED